MRGPNGERLGDYQEGEDPREGGHRPVSLTVVDADGVERPGFMLRAGDLIERTDYDHGRWHMTATVGSRRPTLRVLLRSWWEGWR